MEDLDKIIFISIYFLQLTVWCIYNMYSQIKIEK
jgi:hypothetical protein